MVLQIFGDSISGNCLKVKWTADFLRIPYEWTEIDILKGESRTPEFLAMNPAGQVPVVRLGDNRTLAQSNAIILHLAEESSLIPSDPFDRAKMMEWLFWEQYSHEPYIAVARFQVRYRRKPVAELDTRLAERGNAALARLELATQRTPFLVGDRITLADISLVAYTRMAHHGGFNLAHYPNVLRWVRKIEEVLNLGVAE
jgi:glutathione S-transferase